jgi:uncharacterized membrane protein (UPF0127 family)
MSRVPLLLGTFALIATTVALSSASPRSGAASVSVLGDRTVKIHTGSGDYLAFDRGIENVWVGTPREFARWRVARLAPNLTPRPSSVTTQMLGGDTPIPEQPGGWNEIAMISPTFMLLAHPERSGRPRIRATQRYVNVSWPTAWPTPPVMFFVDLVNGAIARPIVVDKVDEWATIDFAVPASSVAHRAMLVVIHGGKPMAMAFHSVAWVTYRGYKAGQDVSAAEVRALLALDPSLPKVINAADIDPGRVHELQQRSTAAEAHLANPSPSSQLSTDRYVSLSAPNAELRLLLFASQAEREKGLVGRRIAAHTGGLFVYPNDATQALWTKGMTVPLDFVFVTRDGTVTGVVTLPAPTPGARDADVPSIHGFGSYVIALGAGEAASDGLARDVRLTGLPGMDASTPR